MLAVLVRTYHHLQNEHERAAPESGTRRRVEERLLDIRGRFDRLLAEWVPDDDRAREWQDHLHYRAAQPDGPPPIRPLFFRGYSEAGSVAEIRGNASGELVLVIDGAPVERFVGMELAATGRFALVRPGRLPFVETFTASRGALRELARFLDEGGSPPWDYAVELLSDGVIDVHFALTPRGHRALAL